MSRVRKAVMPAAGLGTRLLPATKAVPKEMMPVVDRPAIQWVVEELAAAGIEVLVLVNGRGKGVLSDHFDHAWELEDGLERRGRTTSLAAVRRPVGLVEVIEVRQRQPLGLGHAVLCARAAVGEEPFAVLLPDDLWLADVSPTCQLLGAWEATGKGICGLFQVPATDLVLERFGQGERYPHAVLWMTAGSTKRIDTARPRRAEHGQSVLGRVPQAWRPSPFRRCVPPRTLIDRPSRYQKVTNGSRPARRSQARRSIALANFPNTRAADGAKRHRTPCETNCTVGISWPPREAGALRTRQRRAESRQVRSGIGGEVGACGDPLATGRVEVVEPHHRGVRPNVYVAANGVH